MINPIDAYCERIGTGLWAEPLNALTNFAFFVAVLLAWRFARQQGTNNRLFRVLAGLAVALGGGSLLFHTYATTETKWVDTAFIALFALVYGVVAMRQIVGWRWSQIVTSVILFLFGLAVIVTLIPEEQLNGSAVYLPFEVMFVVFAILLQIRHQSQIARYIWVITAIFSAALLLRTIDLAVCPAWPMGTHFGWHLLLAGVVYLLLRLMALPIAHRLPMDVPRNMNGRHPQVDATPEQR